MDGELHITSKYILSGKLFTVWLGHKPTFKNSIPFINLPKKVESGHIMVSVDLSVCNLYHVHNLNTKQIIDIKLGMQKPIIDPEFSTKEQNSIYRLNLSNCPCL